MDPLIRNLVTEQNKASAEQLDRIAGHVAAAPFAEDLLEVDEPLWGGFWQGDVIAPGYQLPAVELALLRAVRLDKNWPEHTTVPQFLADLRQTILDPQVAIRVLTAAELPCLVFAALTRWSSAVSSQRSVTVVWYCATTGRLHAGYRTQRDKVVFGAVDRQSRAEQSNWLAEVIKQREADKFHPLAVRLDTAILRLRCDDR